MKRTYYCSLPAETTRQSVSVQLKKQKRSKAITCKNLYNLNVKDKKRA